MSATSAWRRMSRAERDAAYNNSAAVVDSPALNAGREARSAAFRAAHPGHLDVAYGATARQAWDLFPADRADAPLCVFIHGGYWQRNSREGFACLAAGLRELGWAVALPGYTLAPEASLTAIVAEIDAALTWLAAHGPARGIGGGHITVSGWSAGGHLTAMAMAHPAVHAGMAISGVFELGPIRDTYLNEKLALTDDEIVTLSPLRLPVVRKPLDIAYGSRELTALVEDSRALHGLRAAADAPGVLLPVAGADHFTILPALEQASGEIARQIASRA